MNHGKRRTETEKKETVIASHEDTDLARVLIGKKGRGGAAGGGGGGGGGLVGGAVDSQPHERINPFTAPACKISRLKSAHICPQTVYFPVV